ncbi:MAG: TetR family transcriptional regulator [Myxococcota bacterium]
MGEHGHRRNAAETRERILAAARAAFARAGYDGVGVREIARDAGVTAMLINRYFGSKEGLFEAVLDATMAEPVVLSAANLADADPARRLAEAIVDVTDPGCSPLDGFLILMRSASSPRAAALAWPRIEAGHLARLVDALRGPDREARAAVVLAFVAGLKLFRSGGGLRPLVETPREVLVATLEPALRALLEPPG